MEKSSYKYPSVPIQSQAPQIDLSKIHLAVGKTDKFHQDLQKCK